MMRKIIHPIDAATAGGVAVAAGLVFAGLWLWLPMPAALIIIGVGAAGLVFSARDFALQIVNR
jgi:hypothetical protein